MLLDFTSGFINKYPLINQAPIKADHSIELSGLIDLNLQYKNNPIVDEEYEISIILPSGYPRQLPIFKEISNKIPKTPDFHINDDGSLCLGSPLRLKLALSENGDLLDFCTNYLNTYLYAASLKKNNSIQWVFGELAHGNNGELTDYEQLFNLQGKIAVISALQALSVKKRVANKHSCPCGCKNRLGKCPIRHHLNSFRHKVSRKEFTALLKKLT